MSVYVKKWDGHFGRGQFSLLRADLRICDAHCFISIPPLESCVCHYKGDRRARDSTTDPEFLLSVLYMVTRLPLLYEPPRPYQSHRAIRLQVKPGALLADAGSLPTCREWGRWQRCVDLPKSAERTAQWGLLPWGVEVTWDGHYFPVPVLFLSLLPSGHVTF